MWCWTVLIFLFVPKFGTSDELKEIIFGGVFEQVAEEEDSPYLTDEQAFKFAVYIANIELQSASEGFQFKALTESVFNHTSGPFKAKLATCSLIDQQALVIFGPKYEEDINIVQSICDYKDVAHVITKWVYDPTEHRSIINFYPHSAYLTSAYFTILELTGWKTVTLFYEDNESLLRMGDLLKMAKNAGIVVVVKQLDEVGDGIYRTTLKQAVRSGEKNYIIDCSIDILQEVLIQAQQVGLMTSHYSFIITNLDLQTIDLEAFQYSSANITGIRLLDPFNKITEIKSQAIIGANFNPNFDIRKMKLETALLIDAVLVLARVITKQLSFQDIEIDNSGCNSLKSSRHGYTILNHVKTLVEIHKVSVAVFQHHAFLEFEYADMHLVYGESRGKPSTAFRCIALGFLTEECPVDKLLWKLSKGCEKLDYFSLQHRRDPQRSNRVLNIEKQILDGTKENSGLSTRQWVVSRTLHEQLLYSYYIRKVQRLTPTNYPVRRRFCRWVFQKSANNHHFLTRVLAAGEVRFTRDGVVTFHNVHVCALENPHAIQFPVAICWESKNIEMTGLIEFDGNGFRGNFDLDIIEINENGINKIGTWNSSKGLITTQPEIGLIEEDETSLRNKTFKVITCLTDPYCMLKETTTSLFGNDRYEGFAIDLIHELAMMEGFNYTFLIREDKANGAKDNVTLKWTGMIGDVIDGTADLAITDLTINAEREEAVDFTSPFMNLGISILAKKPGNAPPSFFSFADPFALDTWVMLAIAYVAVSLSFFIMGRLCQEEWTNPYPCVEEPEFLINQYSFKNSFWFAIGCLMQQGTEIAPIATATRMVAAMWWFFVLIMVSSYTANLAAFLATENPIHLFTDVTSLVQNKDIYNIRLGAKAKGATEAFFKSKDDPIYKAIAQHMEKHSKDMVKDNKDGVKLAEDYNYAFFMESVSIEYETQRHCNLQQYGKLLDDKGYGIAMRKNSTYRTKLSTAILKLQSNGELDKLKRKWWEEKRGGGQCVGGGDDDGTPPLQVQNIQGVFYVTIIGAILAIFLVIAEVFIAAYKLSKKTNIPFREILKLEKAAFLNLSSDTKPAIRANSKSGSKSSKDTETSNNNLNRNPTTYGFIPTIVKEELN